MKKRIQAILSENGVCSRRTAEEWIKQGRIQVNGETAAIGMQADLDTDEITADGQSICKIDKKIYVILNKPVGYVTTLSDEKGRRTAADLVSAVPYRIYPVGRLDIDSDGLLIMTNDGELTNLLTHPSHEIDKVYVAEVSGNIRGNIDKLRSPLIIDGYKIRPAKVEILSENMDGGKITVTIHEGRNRQVRKMCSLCGLKVKRLHRVAIGDLKIGSLPYGKWRYLTEDEIKYLKRIAGMEKD